jgi:cullin 1
VQTILEVHRKFNALVITAFNNDSGFVASLDKACGELVYFFLYSPVGSG